MNMFTESQFGYCPLVCMFHGRIANRKVIHLHKRALRIVYKNYISLRYFNFEQGFTQPWCHGLYLFGSQVPVTEGEFELRISCMQSSYLTH